MTRQLRLGLTAVLGTVILALPALAAGEAGSGGGLPQLDHTKFVPQLAWLAVTFALMYLLMGKVVLPRIGAVLEAREARIRADLDAAQAAKAQADAAAAELDKATTKARTEAQAAIRAAAEAAKAEVTAAETKANAELAARLSAAEARITAAKATAMGGLGSVAAAAAADVVNRLTGGSVGAADPAVQAAVGAALAARRG